LAKEYFVLAAAGIGIVGSLGGVIIGQRMSRAWQREQWVMDHRIQEFRELLDALANSLRIALMMYAGAVIDAERQREILAAHSTAMRVIRSRIFVMEEVIRFNIEVRWAEALNHHNKTLDIAQLATVFNEIRGQIVEAARAHQSMMPRVRRLFRRKRKGQIPNQPLGH
jgi:hypothetical protein